MAAESHRAARSHGAPGRRLSRLFLRPPTPSAEGPQGGECEFTISGFVADNHALIGSEVFLPVASNVSSVAVSEVDVAYEGRLYRVLLPRSTALGLHDYCLIEAEVEWRRHRRRWRLLARRYRRLSPGTARPGWKRGPWHDGRCTWCGDAVPGDGAWGLSDLGRLECAECGVARGERSSAKFRAWLRKVARV